MTTEVREALGVERLPRQPRESTPKPLRQLLDTIRASRRTPLETLMPDRGPFQEKPQQDQ